MNLPHIWLRAETKPDEQRTPLTPKGAQTLLKQGFKVSVEESVQNIYPLEEYHHYGCNIVPSGSWINAPQDAYILGLKELPEDDFPLIHKHIYFAHAYKGQQGARCLLKRFLDGNGSLLDLEYLFDENNRRVAAFGYWAGYAGAALAIWAWANKNNGFKHLPPIKPMASQTELINQVTKSLLLCNEKPNILVIGALGRSGTGACTFAKQLGLKVAEWDVKETQSGGPFTEINQADILINCVLAHDGIPPLITKQSIKAKHRKLSIIADVSCDPYSDFNPIQLYDECTSFNKPIHNVIESPNSLDVIAIDNLPSLLPKEASEDYCNQLVQFLLQLADSTNRVWVGAQNTYRKQILALAVN